MGNKRSQRKASKTHQFGYGKERYFYSFIVALTIFSIGGIFAIREGLEKIHHPSQGENFQVALAILLIAIILESISFTTAIKESNKIRGEKSWGNFIKLSKSPELPVVLMEDLAALSGLVLAFLGVGLSMLTKNYRFDAMASIGIGLLLIIVATLLAIEMKSLLLGESVDKKEEKTINQDILSFKEVEKIIHLKSLHLSPEEILLAVKIGVKKDLTMKELDILIDRIEKKIRKSNKNIKLIYIEPAIYKKSKNKK